MKNSLIKFSVIAFFEGKKLYFSSFDFSSYARVPLNTGLHTTV
jgi:hypothetical protein